MLLKTLLTVAAMAACPLSLCAQNSVPASPHPMNLDDLFRLQEVGASVVSPHGKWVAYTVSTTDVAADKRLTHVWMVNWEGTEDIQMTFGEDSESAPLWSPDGKYLSFMSGRKGAAKGSQVWVLDRRGGEARQFTDVKGELSAYAWSPDSKRLLLTIRPEDEPEKPQEKGAEEKPKPIVLDRYHFKQDVVGYLSGDKHTQIYLYDVATHKLDRLTSDKAFDERGAMWSPDGMRVAYISNHDADPDRTTNSDVFVVDAKPGSTPRRLTTFAGPDGGRLAWSPDSRQIAFLHGSEPKFEEYNQFQLAVVAADGGEPRVLTAKLDRAVSQPLWSADGK